MQVVHTPRVKVNVTADILRTAIEGDSSHCMIADAVRVAYPRAQRVSVDVQTIRFSDPDKGARYIYLTPRSAQLAILQFDEGVMPEPFSVVLRSGQAVPYGDNTRRRDGSQRKPLTPAQEAAHAASRAKGAKVARQGVVAPEFVPPESLETRTARKTRTRAQSVSARPDDVSRPAITGGKATPVTTVGRRRVFGIKGIGRAR